MLAPLDDALTLLVTHAGRRPSWYIKLDSLRPHVSRVIVVDDGCGAYLLPLLGAVFPGLTPERFRVAGAAGLSVELGELGGWVLMLEAGSNVSVSRRFCLPARRVPHGVIHRLPGGREAYWWPALLPGDAACFSVDEAGRVTVEADLFADACQADLVIDRNAAAGSGCPPGRRLGEALARVREGEPGEPVFDVAERHFDLGRHAEAAFWYRRCIKEGADPESGWTARYRLARCLELTGRPWPEVEAALGEAFDFDPGRAEPLYHLARHFLEAGSHNKAMELAAVGLEIDMPRTRLTFEISIYQHELPLVYLACAAALRRSRDCVRVANRLMRQPGVPDDARNEAAAFRSEAVARLQPFYPLSLRRRNRIVVIAPFRNAGEFLHRCVASLAAQDYAHSRFVLIDDASTDGALETADIADSRFVVIRNDVRRGTIHNQLDAIARFCEPGDIAVYVDGDDRLIDAGALGYINDFFNATRCRVMYGQYRDSSGRYGNCEPFIESGGSVLEAIGAMHFPMHIRAHRAGLIDRLKEVDPPLQRLRDDNGEFLDAIADMAMMRAVMQLAGLERIRYSDRVLYEYNTRNPESHYREHARKQRQDRQSRVLESRYPLQPVTTCAGDRWPPTGGGEAANTRLLFISLDGMTPRLIHRWAAEGLLPNLAKLLEAGHARDVAVPKAFGNDAFWNSLTTGTLPGEHGYYYRNCWRPAEHGLRFYDIDNELGAETFWERHAGSELEMAIIDLPEVRHAGRVNGLEVTEWVTHARLLPARFVPAALEEDWIGRFGVDPTGGNTETMIPRRGREFVRLRDQLLATVEQKTRAALHYLDRGGWDLFAVGYSQGHDAGHQFWHIHDPGHPAHRPIWLQRYGDPLLQMYQAIDRGVGRLIERAGDAGRVMAVAGVAMEAKVSCNAVLDEILWAIERAGPGPLGEDVTRGDRRRRRFFAVPHNNLSGAVRINLKGRETAAGVVEPGAEYTAALDTLERCLRQIVNADTGEPVVDEFVRTHDACQGRRLDALPDLFVLWNRRSPIARIWSPWLDEIVLRPKGVTDTRSGDHVGHAEMITNFEPPFAGPAPIPVQDIASGLMGLLESGR